MKNRSAASNLVCMLAASELLLLAGSGSSFAGTLVPELDPGSSVGGIALAITAAVLLAERYRRRG